MRFEEYFEPLTIEECLDLKMEFGKNALILAGGTDVVPKLKSGALKPKAVISLHKIPDMIGIKAEDNGLRIGALTSLREISLSGVPGHEYEVIREAAGHVSSMQVRNTATIGGNACNASPSADAVQGLLVLDAVCLIRGKSGTSERPISGFWKGPGETVLALDEILTGFFIPKPADHTGAAYVKYAIRGDTDISIVGAAAAITLSGDGTAKAAVISLASVAPVPLRVPEAGAFIAGKKVTQEVIAEAAEIAGKACAPIDDQRASADYRREMVRVQTRLALDEALKRAM